MSACDASEYKKVDDKKTYCYTDACPENTYLKKISEKKCFSTCDSGFYKIYEGNSICTDVCETTQFAEIADGSKPSQCVNDCTLKFFEDAKTETTTPKEYRKCVKATADKYFVIEDIEIDGAPVKYTHYYAACP